MTKEEKIAVLKALWRYKDCGYSEYEIRESLKSAIEELLKEPCEDCVSRKVIDQNIYDYAESNGLSYANMKNYILDAPSVTPTQKWVSCSERLPVDFQRVLVTIVRYNGDKVVRVAEYSRRTFKIKENHEQWNVGEKGLLAWMPMPKGYEEKEN